MGIWHFDERQHPQEDRVFVGEMMLKGGRDV
jgi:hypothetical protein